MYYREMEGTFPNKDSIYEYVVDPKTKAWVHWEERLRSGWKYNPRYVRCWSVVVAGCPCYVVNYSKLQAICVPPPSLLTNANFYFRQSFFHLISFVKNQYWSCLPTHHEETITLYIDTESERSMRRTLFLSPWLCVLLL